METEEFIRPQPHTTIYEDCHEYRFKDFPDYQKIPLFKNEASNFDGGQMQVVFECSSYEPGETVHGVVYIRALRHLECKSVFLDIFGREEVGMDGKEAEEANYEGQGAQRRLVTEKFKINLAKTDTILNMAGNVCQTPGGLEKGDYQVQFEFELGQNIPSSYSLKQETIVEEQPQPKSTKPDKKKQLADKRKKELENLTQS